MGGKDFRAKGKTGHNTIYKQSMRYGIHIMIDLSEKNLGSR